MVLSPLVAVVEVFPPSLQPPSIRGSGHQGLLAADLPGKPLLGVFPALAQPLCSNETAMRPDCFLCRTGTLTLTPQLALVRTE